MAKQVGPLFFEGTIDGLIFYKLGDKYYTRSKGSYKSAKHMRRNPKYQRTLQKANQFGQASKLVQEVYYRHLPKALRKHGLYGTLTGRANTLLQEGKGQEEVRQALTAYCQSLSSVNCPLSTQSAPAPTTEQPTQSITAQCPAIHPRPKQARYLSQWKVKRNGQLHIPTQDVVGYSTSKQSVSTTDIMISPSIKPNSSPVDLLSIVPTRT